MRKKTAVAGSAGFLLIAPGVVAGVVPWWLTRWQPGAALPVPVRVTGGLLTAAGIRRADRVVRAVRLGGPGHSRATRTHRAAGGARALPACPQSHVPGRAGGHHRPGPPLGRPVLLGYAAAVGGAFTAFVYGYEQPTLARRYGAQYEAYRRAVPAGGHASGLLARCARPDPAPASHASVRLAARSSGKAAGWCRGGQQAGTAPKVTSSQCVIASAKRPARIPADMAPVLAGRFRCPCRAERVVMRAWHHRRQGA